MRHITTAVVMMTLLAGHAFSQTGGTLELDGGFWAVGAAVEGCSSDGECDDADDCTTDVCDPGDPSADAFGCVNTCTPKLFADIVPLFCPPTCPQPDIDDILCTIDGFGAGPNWPDVCPDGDLSPCAPNGDGILNIDDILKVIDAFGGNPGCPDPRTCP